MIDGRLKSVIEQIKSTTTIPVIVRLNVLINSAAQQQLEAAGLTVTKQGKISPIIYGYGTGAIINSVDKLGIVTKISYDEPVYSAVTVFGEEITKIDTISITDSISSMGVTDAWDKGFTGAGISIGVVDTGVSQEHPMLKPALKGVYSAVPGETVEDEHDHGSWCCSAAAGRPVETEHGNLVGAAPDANLYALKALSNNGTGKMSWVMQCMEKAAVDFDCDVISMSLGSLFDNAGLDPISELVNDIVTASSTICVIAAGNSFIPISIGSPGGAIGALTIGSHSLRAPTKLPSTFESKGPTTGMLIKPDTSAPGGNIPAPGYAELIMAAGAHGTYVPMAGTSMATPQAAGVMALLKQADKTLTRADIEQLLAMTAFPRLKDTLSGFGPLNATAMLNNLNKARVPLVQFQEPFSKAQAMMFAPLIALPKADNQRLKVVRLPAFGA